MTRLVLRIAGVNLENTAFDTDDLATVRGSSWALLSAATCFGSVFCEYFAATGSDDVDVDEIYAGASAALFRIRAPLSCEDVVEAASQLLRAQGDAKNLWPKELQAVLRHLTFTVVAEEDDGRDFADLVRGLENSAAREQYRQLDVDLPELLSTSERVDRLAHGKTDDAWRLDPSFPCAIDNVRPRAEFGWRSVLRPEDGERRAVQDVPVSASVAARKHFGRTGRRNIFYEEHAGLDRAPGFGFSDDFEEIAAEDVPSSIPGRLARRMAVLYMDGNRFGRLRKAFVRQDPVGAEKRTGEFSSCIIAPHRRALLKGLVEACKAADALLLQEPRKRRLDGEKEERQMPVLRFETLLWGGDEACFVFPAWGLLTVLRFLARFLRDAAPVSLPDGRSVPLTYAIGVAICRHKTPIRLVRKLAMELSDNAKERAIRDDERELDLARLASFVDITTLAGYEVPLNGIGLDREHTENIAKEDQPKFYPLPLSDLETILDVLGDIRGISGEEARGIPRARLVDLFEDIRECGDLAGSYLASAKEVQPVRELFAKAKYLRRNDEPFGSEYFEEEIVQRLPAAPLSFLHHVLALWDHLGADEGEEAA
ncbi:hypothetical protein L0F51_09600 [Afifella sp. H1R]|uniref:hypothetical protein n=1 Tax=Afifella sp. H1R TaxID=2908841 RepID=UPI001F2605CA|nr:hypothetical protein [Afifella sp. H1R]MCF1504017.1 hypothetical protein [Afifella sp. H1R]